jgi:hypothetical protein
MALCRHYHGQFMIVLPDKCRPWVWEEVEALKPRPPHHRKHQHRHGRQPQFWWVNDITSSYEGDRKSLLVQGVGCEETWQDLAPESGELIAKQTQYVWLSSQRLDHHNVHERCNLGARQRLWHRDQPPGRKASGLPYEHAFSYHWNALQGYHYLMPLAHWVNALALAHPACRPTGARPGRAGVFTLCALELALIAGCGVRG